MTWNDGADNDNADRPTSATAGGPMPPDLQQVMMAWQRLPDAAKAGIVAIVEASLIKK